MNRNNRLFTEGADGINYTPVGMVLSCALMAYGKIPETTAGGQAISISVFNEILSAATKNGFAKCGIVKARLKRRKGFDSSLVDLLEELCANVGDGVMTDAFNRGADRVAGKNKCAAVRKVRK
jgi:hypothetical protein